MIYDHKKRIIIPMNKIDSQIQPSKKNISCTGVYRIKTVSMPNPILLQEYMMDKSDYV